LIPGESLKNFNFLIFDILRVNENKKIIITNPVDIEKKSITDQQHWCEPRLQIVQWGLPGELISMLPIVTYLRKFSSRAVEEYWCCPNYGP